MEPSLQQPPGFGIWLNCSSHNIITGNSVANNCEGIVLSFSSNNNIIFHNNFINNARQASISESASVWDDGYPSGGNYWSDYTGVDYYSGPYQNETGSDGIGDTPYVIDEDNIDRYPLVEPWLIVTATIDFDSDTLNLGSKGKWVTVYIELPEGYNVDQIDVSSIMLNGTVQALTTYTKIGDYDSDGIPDLMVKFDREDLIALFNGKTVPENYVMEVTGIVAGRFFKGRDIIKVISPP